MRRDPATLDHLDLDGALSMAVARHFAINAVRLGKGKCSIKATCNLAGWDLYVLASLLCPIPVNPRSN